MQKDNHRILKAEFQPLYLVPDGDTTNWKFQNDYVTDYRPVVNSNNRYWVSEHKLDLSGYAMEDLTTYFTDSFEQRGGASQVTWVAPLLPPPPPGRMGLNSFSSSNFETVVLSSVPITDSQLLSMAINLPGFANFGNQLIDFGNFDRTHIIHGTSKVWTVDSTFSGSFDQTSGAYLIPIQSLNFSSLEPTAADAIYCYRLFNLTNAAASDSDNVQLNSITFPPMRVLLGAVVDEEPTLEYMMRLKRSYELANQL